MSESLRLAALREYDVLDTPADPELSAVVRTAAVVAGVPTATLNLIDDTRQCQLTTVGFPGTDAARGDSMCGVVFQGGRSTRVTDARLDPRFAANPWVTGRLGRIRFYASVPLITSAGHALGTLCVFDTEPRRLGDPQMAALEDLAAVVLALFDRRRDARRKAQLATAAEQERARAEAYLRQLRERQDLLDAVQESIDVAIVACDAQGRLTLVNRAARRWHGIDPHAELGTADRLLRSSHRSPDGGTPLPGDDLPLHRALHDGRVDRAEIVIAAPHRPELRVLCSGRALTGPDGGLAGAVIAMTDITAEHQQRQELVDREQLLSAVVESAPDACITTDSTGAVTAWNPAAEKMFGWAAPDTIGRPLEELIIPEHLRAAHAHGLARRAATGEVRLSSSVQVPALRRDGSGLLVELSLGSFNWRGERRFHAFLRDVTEREAASLRLTRANTDLAAANDELDAFTAMIAHDLRSPLTAIAGYAEILEEVGAGEHSAEHGLALSAITRATARMRAMIEDLLDYSRAANEPLTVTALDPNAIVDELAAELRVVAMRTVRITRDPLPRVRAHPTLLRQVLANLLDNAVKYVSPDVEPHVHVSAALQDTEVVIAVADNGIGIAPDSRERVFAMFHRENARGRRGSGIGLATCRRIVKRHDGRIWIDESAHAGTVVKLALPR